jgi:murein DD-endopeptidase MepM/ murein hydrolase activator NlpD
LEGYSQQALIEAVSNPFNPPERLGSDDPHQAVDLAVTQNGMALAGDVVLAMLSGRAAAVIVERFPYGNALMIETPLDELPADWLTGLALPTLAPTLPPHPALTCPQVEGAPDWGTPSTAGRSLYLLYAHMQEPVAFQLDDPVACGARIGRIGQSGNALNPHVHIEARLGPAGARFTGMAHYESRATPQEMSNYCAWRVSGVFQLVDPMRLLALLR